MEVKPLRGYAPLRRSSAFVLNKLLLIFLFFFPFLLTFGKSVVY